MAPGIFTCRAPDFWDFTVVTVTRSSYCRRDLRLLPDGQGKQILGEVELSREITVKIVRDAKAELPVYMTEHAAGMDVRALIDEPVWLPVGGRLLVPTGIAVAVPPGYELQVRPRSGLAIKHGITLGNSPGTIDADYRGEIKLIMINHGQEDFLLRPGDRLAQLVLAPVFRCRWQEVSDLADSVRGAGGFGHTGRQ